MALDTVTLPLRSKTRLPLSETSPEPRLPALPPLPIWSVPLPIVVPPLLVPVRIRVPVPLKLRPVRARGTAAGGAKRDRARAGRYCGDRWEGEGVGRLDDEQRAA